MAFAWIPTVEQRVAAQQSRCTDHRVDSRKRLSICSPRTGSNPVNTRLKQILRNEEFCPSWLGLFTNPAFIARRSLAQAIASYAPRLTGTMLDFGCGQKPYEHLFHVDEYVGLDIEASGHSHATSKIDVLYDGKQIPFDDGHFDSAFSSEVFEHVFNIKDILSELYRVLKPNGLLLVTAPFVWEEHEAPYDFARYSSFGLKHLLVETGFDVVAEQKTSSAIEAHAQLWAIYLRHVALPKQRFTRRLLIPVLITPVNLFGILLSKLLPRNDAFYLNNLILVRKPENQFGRTQNSQRPEDQQESVVGREDAVQ